MLDVLLLSADVVCAVCIAVATVAEPTLIPEPMV